MDQLSVPVKKIKIFHHFDEEPVGMVCLTKDDRRGTLKFGSGNPDELSDSFLHTPSFNELPSEVMAIIFGCLDLAEQCRLRRVCRGWELVLKSPPVLRHVKLDMTRLKHLQPYRGDRLSHKEETYIDCMRSVRDVMVTLSIIGFSNNLVTVGQEHIWLEERALDYVRDTSVLSFAFSKSTVSNKNILDLMPLPCRRLTLTDSRLQIVFPTNNARFVDFEITGSLAIDLCSADRTGDMENQAAVVDNWLMKLAEERVNLRAQYRPFVIKRWKPHYPLRHWIVVKVIIAKREIAHEGLVADIEPLTFDFRILKPLTRLEIGFYLDRQGLIKY